MKNGLSRLEAVSVNWKVRLLAILLILGAGVLTLAFPQQTRTGAAKATQGASERHLAKPSDARTIGLALHLLDRYAKDVPNKTDLDKRIEQRLSRRPGSRQNVQRMMAKFRSIPLSERRNLLGDWADAAADRTVPMQEYRTAMKSKAVSRKAQRWGDSDVKADAAKTGATQKHVQQEREPDRQQVPERQRPEDLSVNWQRSPVLIASLAPFIPAPQAQYRIAYTGIRCVTETDWDHATPSDEIYILTQVTDPQGESVSERHPKPHNPKWYRSMDDGDRRKGPERTCWTGSAEDVTLTVIVMEQDSGDPEEARQAMEEAGDTLIDMCKATGEEVCEKEWLAVAVQLLVGFLTGGEDDVIEEVSRTLTAGQIRQYAGAELRYSGNVRIPYNFYTEHEGEGAEYRVCFTVRRSE